MPVVAAPSRVHSPGAAGASAGAAECRAWRGWPLTPMLGRPPGRRANCGTHRNARASQRLVSDGARSATDPRPTCGAQPTGGIPNLSEPGLVCTLGQHRAFAPALRVRRSRRRDTLNVRLMGPVPHFRTTEPRSKRAPSCPACPGTARRRRHRHRAGEKPQAGQLRRPPSREPKQRRCEPGSRSETPATSSFRSPT